MLTNLVINILQGLSNSLHTLFPAFDMMNQYSTQVINSLDSMCTFLGAVNCLLPLPDIFRIIYIDLCIKIFKLTLFIGNWTLKQTLAIIPF